MLPSHEIKVVQNWHLSEAYNWEHYIHYWQVSKLQ